MRKGRSLELLVKHLEQILSGREGVTVESPKRFKDRVTGQWREHDVVITTREKHRELYTAIECRDRSRLVGKPEVEAFKQKIEDTNVHFGVIVSNKGFRKTAIIAAKHYGIQCLSIQEASSFDWLGMKTIDYISRKITHTHIKLVTEPKVCGPINDFILQDVNGNNISVEHIRNAVNNKILSFLKNDALNFNSTQTSAYKFECKNLYVKRISTNEDIFVASIDVVVEYITNLRVVPLSLMEYRDDTSKNTITTGAVADININSSKYKLYITMGEDGGEVSLIKCEHPKTIIPDLEGNKKV